MRSDSITKVVHNPGDPLPDTGTDWARVDSLTDAEVHTAAVSDPDAQPLTAARLTGMRKVVNLKKRRERLGLTQQAFADAYGIPVGTLRDWERRRRTSDAPARANLEVIDTDPESIVCQRRIA
ncbi:helix-turn-helix domain-containing protein (plasmid) [Skermanella sp. TT6]|uniref:Helix-turn-helix domain-containing protein n=1 Tax=Skermanella cutis TaxID=2775420 RepID=A0ABX7BGL3_9PROT|nr:helix-turn-helix domain-containing protein [Skermanella sp. TT6]QQP93502.1 helix-turn-helix domain-containing protein [Skermanella sp. TT6]